MKRKPYSSDLTDVQWAILAPLIPVAKKQFVNKILRGERAGTGWRIHKAAHIIAARKYARTFLCQRLDRPWMANHRLHASVGETAAGRFPTSDKMQSSLRSDNGIKRRTMPINFPADRRCTGTIGSGLSRGCGRALMLF